MPHVVTPCWLSRGHPTHQDGSLIFPHQAKERTFDTENLVSSRPPDLHAAFVAFFSDVEHEVSVVTSGYRITLTYNPKTKLHLHCLLSMLGFKSALAALLADPEFLPMGGFIGFGLSHRYPINPATTELSTLARGLKGSDVVLQRICNDLSLELSLKTSYRPSVTHANLHCLLNSLTNFPELTEFELGEDTDFMHYVKSEYGGVYVYDFADSGPKSASEYIQDEVRDAIPIVWIKSLTDRNNFSTPYTGAFGNEAGLSCTYGAVSLVSPIGTAQERNAL